MRMVNKIGLALSGGGYRASAFHIGTLSKLNELRILEKVSVISTISGGSITGAYYNLYDGDFENFKQDLKAKLLTVNVIQKILLSKQAFYLYFLLVAVFGITIGLMYTSTPWISLLFLFSAIVLMINYQFVIFPVSTIIEDIYNEYFFYKKKLIDLHDTPELAINSTNLQTCRPFTFSKRKMDDSAYKFPVDGGAPIIFDGAQFPIARAVAASTCVPNFFTPILISEDYFLNKADVNRCRPELVDGGIYDNQGIHKITQVGSSYECDIIITSDAGVKLPFEKTYKNTFGLLIRTVDLFMQRIKFFQLIQNVYNNVLNGKNKQIAYMSLGWDIEKCISGFIDNLKKGNISREVISSHKIPDYILSDVDFYRNDLDSFLKEKIDYQSIVDNSLDSNELMLARNIATNLIPLAEKQLNALIKHAENITEIQVKLYCPQILKN